MSPSACQKCKERDEQVVREKDKKDFHIHHIIRNTLSLLEAQFLAHSIELEMQLDSKDLMMHGMEDELKQVLSVLIINAKDAILKQPKKNSYHGKIIISTYQNKKV